MNAFAFPPDFRTHEIETNGTTIHVRVRRNWPRGRSAARLWRDGRHVGAHGGRSCSRPYRGGARPAGHGPVLQAGRGVRQEDSGRRRRRRLDALEDRPGRSRHARYRQHGRLCLCRAVSRAGHAVRAHRRAAARRRAVGGNPQEPAALALPLRRAGHGAAGGRPRAHLSRPLLERVLCRPPAVSAKPRASTMPSSTPCPAPCTPASCSSPRSTRMPSTTRHSWPRANLPCLCWRSAARNPSARPWRTSCAFAANDVREGVIPDSGHWIMEENPAATIAMARAFLETPL